MTGTVEKLWRYPIKSMGGERVETAHVTTATGVLGDRAYGLLDVETETIASAKHPRHWGGLLGFRARVTGRDGERHPLVTVELPDGRRATTDQRDIDDVLSAEIGRRVRLVSSPPARATYAEYKADTDKTTREPLAVGAPEGTLFDFSSLHVVTNATLARLRELRPQSNFGVARFRPNVVVDTGSATGFVENDWVGQELSIGSEVRAYVDFPCPRCVMTTLAQGELGADPEILRAAMENRQFFGLLAKKLPSVGVYATIVHGGTIRPGDRVRVDRTSRLRRVGTYAHALKRAINRR